MKATYAPSAARSLIWVWIIHDMSLFRGEPTKEKIFAVAQTIRLMLIKSGVAVGNDDQDAIEKGVERMFDVPQEIRRLRHLALPPNLKPGLKRWVEGGIYRLDLRQRGRRFTVSRFAVFDFASLGEKHNDLLEVEMGWISCSPRTSSAIRRIWACAKHIVMDELWKRMGILAGRGIRARNH